MTYSLRITQEASEQLVSLQRYISAQATPEIAEKYIAELLAHCEGLTVFPREGPHATTSTKDSAPPASRSASSSRSAAMWGIWPMSVRSAVDRAAGS